MICLVFILITFLSIAFSLFLSDVIILIWLLLFHKLFSSKYTQNDTKCLLSPYITKISAKFHKPQKTLMLLHKKSTRFLVLFSYIIIGSHEQLLFYRHSCDKYIHYNKMTNASSHDEHMKYFMQTKIFMLCIK